jgi:hypothetical protein
MEELGLALSGDGREGQFKNFRKIKGNKKKG